MDLESALEPALEAELEQAALESVEEWVWVVGSVRVGSVLDLLC
jgi:hypothetical protein